jgi:HEAT repeat protein
MLLKNVVGLLLPFFLVTLGWAQGPPSTENVNCPTSGMRCGYDGGCISTVVFLERCKHVPLTPAALTAALRNPDPIIRSSAADVLASHTEITGMSVEEITKILTEAFKNEKQIQFEMALDLVHLGAPEGISALKQMCDDNNGITAQRINAGAALAQRGDDGCLNAVLAIAMSGNDEDRASALSTLPEYKHSSPAQNRTIFTVVARALEDRSSIIRHTAGLALVSIGNPDAIPFFEKAIVVEQDRNTKAALETDLHRLRGEQP